METLNAYYKKLLLEHLADTRWFSGAPEAAKKSMQFKLLGVQTVKTASLMASGSRDAVIAQVTLSSDDISETQEIGIILGDMGFFSRNV